LYPTVVEESRGAAVLPTVERRGTERGCKLVHVVAGGRQAGGRARQLGAAVR
jgi:hypothetical protein